MNKVMLTGRLTRENELRYSNEGKGILRNSIAVGDGYGEKKRTYFFNLTFFGKTAEIVAQYTTKGSLLGVMGKLTTYEYEKDGQKTTKIEMLVDEVEFFDVMKENKEEAAKPASKPEKKPAYTDDVELPF